MGFKNEEEMGNILVVKEFMDVFPERKKNTWIA